MGEYSASCIDTYRLSRRSSSEIGQGGCSWDQLNKSFIYGHLRYRFAVYEGAEALPVERAVRAGGLLAGRPYLNPL